MSIVFLELFVISFMIVIHSKMSSSNHKWLSYIVLYTRPKAFTVNISAAKDSYLDKQVCINNGMEEIFQLISDVGLPIAGALTMGFFIFVIIKQIFEGIVESIGTLTMFAESLENRARTMSNEMVKIDLLVSSALGLNPDIERVARAENFVEDGKVDVRRD